jgi:hypothetical protein
MCASFFVVGKPLRPPQALEPEGAQTPEPPTSTEVCENLFKNFDVAVFLRSLLCRGAMAATQRRCFYGKYAGARVC